MENLIGICVLVGGLKPPPFHPLYLFVQVVRAKERLEEELSIQTSQEKQQNTET